MKFRLREATERDLIPTGTLLFEVINGSTTDVFKATPEDVAALSALTVQYNARCGLPIEVGEGLIISG